MDNVYCNVELLVLSSLNELPRRGHPAHDHQGSQGAKVPLPLSFFPQAQRVRDSFTPTQNLAIFSTSKFCYWYLKLLCEYCKSFDFETLSNVMEITKSVTSRLCLYTIVLIHQFTNKRARTIPIISNYFQLITYVDYLFITFDGGN